MTTSSRSPDSESDGTLLAGLVRGLGLIDAHEGCEAPATFHEHLLPRLSYLFLVRRCELASALPPVGAQLQTVEGVLRTLSGVSRYLGCLRTALRTFRARLADAGDEIAPCTRFSEMCRLRRWQEWDGSDPVELVVCVEHTTGCCLEGCPWWEFPVLEIAQALYTARGQYSGIRHRRSIAASMQWHSEADASQFAEMVGVLWGLPFGGCTPTSVLAEMASAMAVPSRFYTNHNRVYGLSEMVCVVLGHTKRRGPRRTEACLRRAIAEGILVRDTWEWLRENSGDAIQNSGKQP